MEQDLKNSNNVEDIDETPTAPSKFDKATFLSEKLKEGAKRLLGKDASDSASLSDEAGDLFEDAAFNPQQTLEANPHDSGSLRNKLHRGAHGLVATIKNPKRAIRSKYTRNIAENLSGQSDSYDKQFDKDLVDAYDALEQARTNTYQDNGSGSPFYRHEDPASPNDSFKPPIHSPDSNLKSSSPRTSVEKFEDARRKFEEIEAKRDSLRAAWILGRHVKRIRRPPPILRKPVGSDFRVDTNDGKGEKLDWRRYLIELGLWYSDPWITYHVDDFDEPPFDIRDLSLTVERLAVVSAPWQNFLIDLRDVYLWEDRQRTMKYMLAYWILWYFQHIATAALAGIMIATIRNRYFPTRVETIRKRVERARNDQAKAQAWGELIQRHGKHDWIEPFLDDVGPHIQLGLGDLSNLLELLQSFYRWERPSRTISTLLLLFSCMLISVFADMKFCVQLIWFGIGCFFFISLPLSARFPKYRRVVNPIYWVFWDIPNLAEVALVQLQEKAILGDARRLEKLQTTANDDEEPQLMASDDEESSLDGNNNDGLKLNENELLVTLQANDRVTFRAVESKSRMHGRLRIERNGLWYYDKKFRKFYQYNKLLEVRKVDIDKANNPDSSKTARIARRIEESTSLQFLPSGLEFIFVRQEVTIGGELVGNVTGAESYPRNEKLAITVSESDRDKIFSLVISWSNLKWQPLFSLNKKKKMSPGSENPAKYGKGNEHFDTAVKSFVE